MKTLRLFLAAVLVVLAACCTSPEKADLKKMDFFIDDLMEQMTLREKIGQLTLLEGEAYRSAKEGRKEEFIRRVREGEGGSVLDMYGARQVREVQRIAVDQSRLHIPMFFGLDVIHGFSTVFPIPLALACSWDMEAIERSARVAAREATAEGLCWTFSPMVDICHDARWGRIAEGAGEDPYLGSRVAEAMVRGYQGTCLADSTTMMACVKHFGLYGAGEAGREYNTVDMSHWRMYNEYLPPYKAAIDAGAFSMMSSFNTVDGVPATGNYWLLTELLRNEWGFQGFVVSDYASISDMIDHGMGDTAAVAELAIEAGLDLDMCSDAYAHSLEQAVRSGRISMELIDQSCRRILKAKYLLGLFDDPYRYCDTTMAERVVLCPEHRAEARRTAAETFVLLKNQGNLLPLQKKGRIALVGPMADDTLNISGMWSWCARPDQYITLREGLRKAVGSNAEILYARGCNLIYDAATDKKYARKYITRDSRSDKELLNEALSVAARADVIVAAVGECSEMSGEGASMVNIQLPDAQRDLLEALAKTGKPIVMLNFTGRPVVLNWENEHLDAILQVWFAGSETADAVADVLFGDVVPSGKLTTTFPRHVGQYPFSYACYNTGRPQYGDFQRCRTNYLDVENDGLFPFGYGLSYTSFDYSPITMSDTVMNSKGEIVASVTITNTGNYDGCEVVQMYIRDVYGSVVRPVKELKGFERIMLKKGESHTVSFSITEETLKFYNAACQHVAEPGDFVVMIGPNSRDVQQRRFVLN
ncbi:MAG: beta-glucosidase BglX [Bacteroidales bacterium]|nr:beta-glucosidase BglX [Bacteroidales bacterium]